MVEYCKRIIIVKAVAEMVRGSIKLERENGTVKAHVEFISKNVNLNGLTWCLSGDTHAVIGETKDAYRLSFELDSNFTFVKGASFSICDLKSEKILCYGEYGTPCLKENTVVKYLFNLNLKEIKSENEEIKGEYDDELIATENYYQKGYEELLLEQIDGIKNKNHKETPKKEIKKQPFSNEKGFGCIENYEYYRKIEDKLNLVLKSHEKAKSLNDLIEGGEFVRINYDKNRSYFVGKIEKDNKPKYICYGIMGMYGSYPENFTKNARFIPESEFNVEGVGYYFIFQNVHTGEVIE